MDWKAVVQGHLDLQVVVEIWDHLHLEIGGGVAGLVIRELVPQGAQANQICREILVERPSSWVDSSLLRHTHVYQIWGTPSSLHSHIYASSACGWIVPRIVGDFWGHYQVCTAAHCRMLSEVGYESENRMYEKKSEKTKVPRKLNVVLCVDISDQALSVLSSL